MNFLIPQWQRSHFRFCYFILSLSWHYLFYGWLQIQFPTFVVLCLFPIEKSILHTLIFLITFGVIWASKHEHAVDTFWYASGRLSYCSSEASVHKSSHKRPYCITKTGNSINAVHRSNFEPLLTLRTGEGCFVPFWAPLKSQHAAWLSTHFRATRKW